MKSLFEQSTLTEITNRLNQLTPETKGLWGKMTVAQMLAHLKEAFKVPLSETPLPRMFMGRLVGWMMKGLLHNNTPWKKSMPTAPEFVIKDDRNMADERKQLMNLIVQFHQKNAVGIGDKVHPFFGKLTAEQWGKSMYKHLNHHLTQFGV
jgi:hypothetical protein